MLRTIAAAKLSFCGRLTQAEAAILTISWQEYRSLFPLKEKGILEQALFLCGERGFRLVCVTYDIQLDWQDDCALLVLDQAYCCNVDVGDK